MSFAFPPERRYLALVRWKAPENYPRKGLSAASLNSRHISATT